MASDRAPRSEPEVRAQGGFRSAEYLRERVEHLEKVHREALDALQAIADLHHLKVSLNQLDGPEAVLERADASLCSLLPLAAAAYYLVDEEQDLRLAHVDDAAHREDLEAAFAHLLDRHLVARAFNSGKPLGATLPDGRECLLQALATPSRLRGLFLGIIDGARRYVPDTSMLMAGIVCGNTAHLLESWELYRVIHRINQDLEARVRELSASTAALEQEVALRRATEEDLRDSRRMLDLVLENIPQYVFWKDRESRYLGCNRNFLRAAGCEAVEAVAGRTDADMPWAGEQGAFFREVEARVMDSREAIQGMVETIRMADGRERFIESNKIPLVDDGGDVVGLLGTFHDVTAQKRYEERLAHQAFHDPLTGLPNRSLLRERLERAISRRQRREDYVYCLMLLDLDRFKNVNDALGHMAGDQLLVELGNRLKQCMREMDTVARLGGDEFAILLEELADPSEAEAVVERIMQAVREPFPLLGTRQFTTASVGIVEADGGYREPEELLRDADIAMYKAKSRGGDASQRFEPGLQERAVYLATLENDMRQGLARGDFHLLYQPILCLRDSRLVGFEALLRWRHPERGVLGPAEFIPLAEKTAFIEELGEFVLAEACAFARGLPGNGAGRPYVAVNVSARQLMHPAFSDGVGRALEANGLRPEAMRLEMTETAVMERAEVALGILGRLREMGLGLAIDDFGTGYSSLSYLQRLPVDTLKIDRLFVGNLTDAGANTEIVRSILALARTLNLDIVAEGVETDAQLSLLRKLECPNGQGFLFARPLPAEEAVRRAAG